MKTRFAGVAGTVQRFVLLRWLKRKVLHELAAYEHGMRLWKHSVGWDRGGSAMPGWVSANETSDQNALREDSWHHFKLARMYNIARRRTKKQNAGLLKPSTTRKDRIMDKPTTDQNAASEGTCESTCSAIPPDYGLVKGQSVYLRCVVSEIKENCVVSVRPAGMGFPSADLNVHGNDIVELPNAEHQRRL